MVDLEWAHAVAALIGAAVGAGGAIFAGGYRAGKTEGKLSESILASEKRMEERLNAAVEVFGETLKGLRQKINDVELDTERRFLLKDDFGEFREEYREDMRELKAMIARGA